MGIAPAPSTTRRFGKYTLVAKLAEGGMAEIFLARLGGAAGFEKLVCIKRILPELSRNQQFVSMFLDEARTVARISHPNVCQVFELGELEGQYYIAMEYLEGVPLSCFRRRDMYPQPPDPQLVCGIVAQACEGLHHAHQLKGPDKTPLEVVHRDVSPANLFVTADGIVKVLDFGIAKIQDTSAKTTTGAVKGTYAYMAPEQLRGEHIDRRVDVFALAAVTWEMLARRNLFKRDTDFLTFQAITTDPLPDICTYRPDCPPELGVVIAKALSRERDARYPTTRAFGEALMRAMLPLGTVHAPSAIGDEVQRAFSDKLDEQRVLIAAAREGGEFDLEESTGPSVGFHQDMVTTPAAFKRPSALMATASATASAEIVAPRGKPSETWRVPPLPLPTPYPPAPERRSSLPTILISMVIAGGLGAGGVYWWTTQHDTTSSSGGASTAPAVTASVPDPVPTATVPKPAAETPVPAATPAVTPAVTIDAGVAESVTGDAAVAEVAPTVAAPVVKKPPPPVVPPKPAGPPGSITIDSAPTYAVIFIDGRRYGETPIVDVKLPPGKHFVKAVSPAGTVKTFGIVIEPGKAAPVKRIGW